MDDYTIGWAGRVMEWLRFAVTLVAVNLLFLAGTAVGLVVFGVMPAATASAIILARRRAGETSEHLVRDFITAYRAQFLHLAVVVIPFWLVVIGLALNAVAFQITALAGSLVSGVLLVLLVVVSVCTLLAAFAAVTICTRYRDSARAVWRYAFVLPLVSPVMSVSLIVSLTGLTLLFMKFGVLVPLIGASATILLACWLVDHRLATLDASHPDGAAARSAALALSPTHMPTPISPKFTSLQTRTGSS